jgi:hypothetical protein
MRGRSECEEWGGDKFGRCVEFFNVTQFDTVKFNKHDRFNGIDEFDECDNGGQTTG